MSVVDVSYCNLVRKILIQGERICTRNANVRRVFAEQIRFDSTPLVSVRKTAWKSALREWEWFMSGSSCLDQLHESVRPWWQPWADSLGYLDNHYGFQFRRYVGRHGKIDQIEYLIRGIKDHPQSRRNLITTWNTEEMAHWTTNITTCHGTVIQTFVDERNALHLVTYQRSADVIVGLAHNWIQYWAFLLWLAHRANRGVGTLTWIGGDCHVYDAHEGLAKQIIDQPLAGVRTPNLVYGPTTEEFRAYDFAVDGEYRPKITTKAEMVI